MENILRQTTALALHAASAYIKPGDVLIDATCGNGHDTAFLASLMKDDAVLYAFDIQACALARTKERLDSLGLSHKTVVYRQGSHDDLVGQLAGPVDIAVFNLGYLPSGDHGIHTKSETTIKAIKICLHKIAINGIIMIAAYPGTEAGAQEEKALRCFLQSVPQREFDVSLWQPINQIHCPPVLYIVQKRG